MAVIILRENVVVVFHIFINKCYKIRETNKVAAATPLPGFVLLDGATKCPIIT